MIQIRTTEYHEAHGWRTRVIEERDEPSDNHRYMLAAWMAANGMQTRAQAASGSAAGSYHVFVPGKGRWTPCGGFSDVAKREG